MSKSLVDIVKEITIDEVEKIAEQLKANMVVAINNNTRGYRSSRKVGAKGSPTNSSGRLANSIEVEKINENWTTVGVNASTLGSYDYSKVYVTGRSRQKQPHEAPRTMKWTDQTGTHFRRKTHIGSMEGHDFLQEAIDML